MSERGLSDCHDSHHRQDILKGPVEERTRDTAQVARIENKQTDLDVVRDFTDAVQHVGSLEIQRKRADLHPVIGANLLAEFFQRFGPAGHEHEAHADASELVRKRGRHALGATCDESPWTVLLRSDHSSLPDVADLFVCVGAIKS